MSPALSVPVGYKMTEVGIIPGDWEALALGKVVKFQRGFDLPSRLRKNGEIPIITSSGYGEFHSESRVNGPGLVTGRYGTIGEVFYVKENFWPLNTTLFVKDFCGNVILFASYLLRTIDFHSHSGKSGVPGVNRNDLHEIAIALPTKVEQQAIAEALSDADALVESLEQLLAKKRQIKQGAMQELLTGQKRLPGFSGEWEVKILGEIAPLQRGFDLPNSQMKQGIYPVVASNGIINHHLVFQVRGPGVVTGRSGTIGNVSYVESDFWPHNTALWVTSFKGNDPKFVFYLYTHIGFEKFATGSGVPTLNRNDVHAFRVNIPATKAEQTAIAAILSDMDADIAALQSELVKAREIKQGMAQALLTGRIRLVAPAIPTPPPGVPA